MNVPPHSNLTRLLVALSASGVAYFLAVTLTEELIRKGYSPLRTTISELALGRYGTWQVSGFLVLGSALLLLSVGLARQTTPTAASRTGVALVAITALAVMTLGVFRTAPAGVPNTTPGAQVHQYAAEVGYLCFIAATLAFGLHFRRDSRWRRLTKPSFLLGGLGLAGAAVFVTMRDTRLAGLSERGLTATQLTWLVLVMIHLLSRARAPSER